MVIFASRTGQGNMCVRVWVRPPCIVVALMSASLACMCARACCCHTTVCAHLTIGVCIHSGEATAYPACAHTHMLCFAVHRSFEGVRDYRMCVRCLFRWFYDYKLTRLRGGGTVKDASWLADMLVFRKVRACVCVCVCSRLCFVFVLFGVCVCVCVCLLVPAGSHG